jgi:hypothetical protein
LLRLKTIAPLGLVVLALALPANGPAGATSPETAERRHHPLAIKIVETEGRFVVRNADVSWRPKERGTEINRIQVRRRIDTPWSGGSAWGYSMRRYQSTISLQMPQAGHACFQLRAVKDGAYGPWTREYCTTRIVRAVQLDGLDHPRYLEWTYGPIWYDGYFGISVVETQRQDAVARINKVRAQTIAIWGFRCDHCGSFRVEFNGRVIGRADLHSRRSASERVFVRTLKTSQRGNIRIVVTSDHRELVRLQAVRVERDRFAGRRA